MAVLRAVLTAQTRGGLHQNILHFNKGDYVTADLQGLAEDLRDNWCQIWKSGVPGYFTWLDISVTRVDSGNDAPFSLAVGITGTGASEDNALPFVSFLFKIQTDFPGRKGRGRFYCGWSNGAHFFQGHVSDTVRAFYATKIDSIVARYGSSGSSLFTLGVTSRTNPGDDFHPMISLTLDSIPRLQRRRNIGSGV